MIARAQRRELGAALAVGGALAPAVGEQQPTPQVRLVEAGLELERAVEREERVVRPAARPQEATQERAHLADVDAREEALARRDALVEPLARALHLARTPVRVGVGEAHRHAARERERALGRVALGALAPRARQHEREHDEAGDEADRHARRQRAAAPRDELAQAVRERERARVHRLAAEPAVEVARELERGLVAPLGLLDEALHHDRREVAVDVRRGAAQLARLVLDRAA